MPATRADHTGDACEADCGIAKGGGGATGKGKLQLLLLAPATCLYWT